MINTKLLLLLQVLFVLQNSVYCVPEKQQNNHEYGGGLNQNNKIDEFEKNFGGEQATVDSGINITSVENSNDTILSDFSDKYSEKSKSFEASVNNTGGNKVRDMQGDIFVPLSESIEVNASLETKNFTENVDEQQNKDLSLSPVIENLNETQIQNNSNLSLSPTIENLNDTMKQNNSDQVLSPTTENLNETLKQNNSDLILSPTTENLNETQNLSKDVEKDAENDVNKVAGLDLAKKSLNITEKFDSKNSTVSASSTSDQKANSTQTSAEIPSVELIEKSIEENINATNAQNGQNVTKSNQQRQLNATYARNATNDAELLEDLTFMGEIPANTTATTAVKDLTKSESNSTNAEYASNAFHAFQASSTGQETDAFISTKNSTQSIQGNMQMHAQDATMGSSREAAANDTQQSNDNIDALGPEKLSTNLSENLNSTLIDTKNSTEAAANDTQQNIDNIDELGQEKLSTNQSEILNSTLIDTKNQTEAAGNDTQQSIENVNELVQEKLLTNSSESSNSNSTQDGTNYDSTLTAQELYPSVPSATNASNVGDVHLNNSGTNATNVQNANVSDGDLTLETYNDIEYDDYMKYFSDQQQQQQQQINQTDSVSQNETVLQQTDKIQNEQEYEEDYQDEDLQQYFQQQQSNTNNSTLKNDTIPQDTSVPQATPVPPENIPSEVATPRSPGIIQSLQNQTENEKNLNQSENQEQLLSQDQDQQQNQEEYNTQMFGERHDHENLDDGKSFSDHKSPSQIQENQISPDQSEKSDFLEQKSPSQIADDQFSSQQDRYDEQNAFISPENLNEQQQQQQSPQFTTPETVPTNSDSDSNFENNKNPQKFQTNQISEPKQYHHKSNLENVEEFEQSQDQNNEQLLVFQENRGFSSNLLMAAIGLFIFVAVVYYGNQWIKKFRERQAQYSSLSTYSGEGPLGGGNLPRSQSSNNPNKWNTSWDEGWGNSDKNTDEGLLNKRRGKRAGDFV